MKRIFLFFYFSFLTFILAAQDPIFVLADTDTVYTTTCDPIDYCIEIGDISSYLDSEVILNGFVVEANEFCNFDTIYSYYFSTVFSEGPWLVETVLNNQELSFNIDSFSQIVDTFNFYDTNCIWEYDEEFNGINCNGNNLISGGITFTTVEPNSFSIIKELFYTFPLGFVLQLPYGENEIIMTHESGYADTSIVSVIHEQQILETVEINLVLGESESYLAESLCGGEMFTFVNLCETNSTGAAELLTSENSFEIKAVAPGTDTICVQYTDEFGFSKRQDFYLSILTSTEDIVDFKLDIYPNPTFDFINISTSIKGAFIEVRDVNGKLMLPRFKVNETEHISLEYFPRGIYFFSVEDDLGRQTTKKVVKI